LTINNYSSVKSDVNVERASCPSQANASATSLSSEIKTLYIVNY